MNGQSQATNTLSHWRGDAALRPVPELQTHPAAAVPMKVDVRVLGPVPVFRDEVTRLLQDCADVRLLGDDQFARVALLVAEQLDDAIVRQLRTLSAEPGQRVVLVVDNLDVSRTAEAMRAGAVGIKRRSEVNRSGLRRLIHTVVAGEAVIPPDVLAALVSRGGVAGRLQAAIINVREERVLRLLADGSDTREIAARLNYSERTVKTIIQEITVRFGLRNRSHAVAYALRQGLI